MIEGEELEAILAHAEGESYVEFELISKLANEILGLQSQTRHYGFLVQMSKEQAGRDKRIMGRVRQTVNALHRIDNLRSYSRWLKKYHPVMDELKEIEDLVEYMYDDDSYIEALRAIGASGSVLAAAKSYIAPDERVPEFL